MRVPISHSLTREEVRRRLRDRGGDIAQFVPGGMAQVDTAWPDEDTMTLSVAAMGQRVDGRVLIEDSQVIFEITLPAALSFMEPMVSGAIRNQGQKLLAP